jgi:hypothetical protein
LLTQQKSTALPSSSGIPNPKPQLETLAHPTVPQPVFALVRQALIHVLSHLATISFHQASVVISRCVSHILTSCYNIHASKSMNQHDSDQSLCSETP